MALRWNLCRTRHAGACPREAAIADSAVVAVVAGQIIVLRVIWALHTRAHAIEACVGTGGDQAVIAGLPVGGGKPRALGCTEDIHKHL